MTHLSAIEIVQKHLIFFLVIENIYLLIFCQHDVELEIINNDHLINEVLSGLGSGFRQVQVVMFCFYVFYTFYSSEHLGTYGVNGLNSTD